MNRPASIITFERFYLGALVVGLVNTMLTWSKLNDTIQVRQANAMIGTWFLPSMMIFGFLIPILLWYFVARRASVVAKWIVVVFYALGVLGILGKLAGHSAVSTLALILSLVAIGLDTVAVIALFKPDAKAWLEGPQGPSIGQP